MPRPQTDLLAVIDEINDLPTLYQKEHSIVSMRARDRRGQSPNYVSKYDEPLNYIREKIERMIKIKASPISPKSPVSNTNSNGGDSPKPKDWEAEAMEWKRIADEWKKEVEDSQKREAEWKSKAEELEKKLLGEENMDKMWNGKFEKLESEVIAKLQQLEVDCAADIKIKEDMIESLQKQLGETREAYFRDIEIMGNEIEDIKREYDGILEERDLEAKKKEDALHQEIEALQKKSKGCREKVETQKNSRVSSGDDSVSPADGIVVMGCHDMGIYPFLSDNGLLDVFTVHKKLSGYRIMHTGEDGKGYLGKKKNGRIIESLGYGPGQAHTREGIIETISEGLEKEGKVVVKRKVVVKGKVVV